MALQHDSVMLRLDLDVQDLLLFVDLRSSVHLHNSALSLEKTWAVFWSILVNVGNNDAVSRTKRCGIDTQLWYVRHNQLVQKRTIGWMDGWVGGWEYGWVDG